MITLAIVAGIILAVWGFVSLFYVSASIAQQRKRETVIDHILWFPMIVVMGLYAFVSHLIWKFTHERR